MAISGFHTLRVAAVDRLCPDAVAVTLAVPPELTERFAFRPGQSLTVQRAGERRTYSICAPAGGAPRIGVREVPGGRISGWIVHDLRVGDELEVAPPSGTFTPDLTAGGRHVLIAAGSGITPMLSIAASLLRRPDAEVVLLYGNRRTDTVMFAEELADLKDRYPARLELVHVLSREPREADLFSGRLDAARLRALLPLLIDVPAVDHWWLCGPFGMVVDATEVLSEAGVAPERIHRELFWADEAPPEPVRPEPESRGPSSEITVHLDGRATTVTVEQGVTLLDGVQRARPDLPFACKGGVCGTCRARVIEGDVAMRRNFALEDAELAAGFVLTCQSTATSPKVVVDFDE
ncbi:phenylacetic acid degradation protein [Actinoplanes sp. SE50]|uniref:1,2-phenylacetyl-CoA epoxidase subunit PaaE n=1 Tax=unclassified Actinoplanes TaxID=2626549 RepID=UPI00023ECE5E|nr:MULTISPECIES: 1,2-phenylacetyl-CoA epoxidase subunit PaaE [unclassified Actinoplanes]AEV83802.1 phenylacetic acid degradation NADH oxidoreductase [Actinoplanes sp. SE50/110]ATO82054.1 phenylacetic acid degradation protein [Actinoplanes sp. SE50]SLL99462.1 phenylacetic acid degradation protein [Actinoplanes sp. SE50/110]